MGCDCLAAGCPTCAGTKAGHSRRPHKAAVAFEEGLETVPKPKSRKPKKKATTKVAKLTRLLDPGALLQSSHLAQLAAAGNEGEYLKSLAAYAAEAVMSKLADGTRKGYDAGWRHWMEFRELQNKSPFLAGETRTERKQDEDDLLTYVAFLSKILKRTEGTIRQKLFAIKFAHTVAGLPDPILRRDRLWAALAGSRTLQTCLSILKYTKCTW